MTSLARLIARVVSVVLLSLQCIPLGPLAAQRLGPERKRPLNAVVDTNNAREYLDYGLRAITENPSAAASAFYWAARIDPSLAEAPYGSRVALLLADPSLLRRFMMSNGKNPSKREQQLDSLLLRALMLNPLLHRALDLPLLQTYVRQLAMAAYPESSRPSEVEVDYAIDRYLRQQGSSMRGWMSYARGDFRRALADYGMAIKDTKEKASLRIERGRIFGIQGIADSAIAEFQLALTELRVRDAKDVVVLYNSKAVVEQTIGLMFEQKNDLPGAREAYSRALQEDLAYWPAHFRLGMLAAEQHDTATALSEFSLATDIATDEPYVQAVVGAALVNLGRPREAIVPLKKAIALEPYYASPHVALGRLHEATGATNDALVAYAAFLARTRQRDPERGFAEARIAAIRAARPPQ